MGTSDVDLVRWTEYEYILRIHTLQVAVWNTIVKTYTLITQFQVSLWETLVVESMYASHSGFIFSQMYTCVSCGVLVGLFLAKTFCDGISSDPSYLYIKRSKLSVWYLEEVFCCNILMLFSTTSMQTASGELDMVVTLTGFGMKFQGR